MNASSVYWIRCQDHTDMMSQGYIGVSKNADARFTQHFKRTQNRHLKFAIDKYGWDNLVKTKILVADNDYCLNIERKLRPTDDIGWNCVTGGGNPPLSIGNKFRLGITPWNKGKKYGPETRKKISDAVSLAMKDPARLALNRSLRLGLPSPRKGQKLTDETRAKISQGLKGKVSPMAGKTHKPDVIEKISASIREFSWICTHCQTSGYGRGAATRWHFDNCKHKGAQQCR